ncbi:MAG: hypothetical protein VB078_07770 [Clostridiaceae bacterium]|nr:hypothetical protein [Clostridiaceae bacterium]
MREIRVEINGQFVAKSSKYAGIQGEGNVTRMRIVFDNSWSSYSKRIIWRDARGQNPMAVILGYEQMTAEGSLLDYTAYIPPEPLAEAGWCSFTIEGYSDEGGTVAVALTAGDRLEVEAGGYGSPAEPTSSQTLQLQHEIDSIISSVEVIAGEALGARDRAETAATAAEASKQATSQDADTVLSSVEAAQQAALSASGAKEQAQEYSALSQSWAVGATGERDGEDVNNARYWSQQAQAAAGGGVISFNGRAGGVMPRTGDYTAAQVGADPEGSASAVQTALAEHESDASKHIISGTLGGQVAANAAAQESLGVMQIRNISAGTADLTAGTSPLATGQIYLVYEA